MRCPHCQHDGKAAVIESRQIDGDVYRKRTCGKCFKGFTSREQATTEPMPPNRHLRPHEHRSQQLARVPAKPAKTDAAHLQGVWGGIGARGGDT